MKSKLIILQLSFINDLIKFDPMKPDPPQIKIFFITKFTFIYA